MCDQITCHASNNLRTAKESRRLGCTILASITSQEPHTLTSLTTWEPLQTQQTDSASLESIPQLVCHCAEDTELSRHSDKLWNPTAVEL